MGRHRGNHMANRDVSMFPECEPLRLDHDAIRTAVTATKPDNSAYLAAMRDFRARYLAASVDGPVKILSVEFGPVK